MRCECGCGYEGPDPVVQWLLEEALLIRLDAQRELDELQQLEQQALTAAVDEARREAIAALEAGG